jgi:hypothetical protein
MNYVNNFYLDNTCKTKLLCMKFHVYLSQDLKDTCKCLITSLSKTAHKMTAIKSKSKLPNRIYSRFTVHGFIKAGPILQSCFMWTDVMKDMVYESSLFKMYTKMRFICFCMAKNTWEISTTDIFGVFIV